MFPWAQTQRKIRLKIERAKEPHQSVGISQLRPGAPYILPSYLLETPSLH